MKKLNKETIKKNIPTIITVVIIGLLAFYGGIMIGSKSKSNNFSGMNIQRQMMRSTSSMDRARSGAFPQSGGLVGGSVVSKDENSITIDVKPNGSRIILFSNGMKVSKSVDGIVDDLKVGDQVFVSGSANKDGSIMANSIQIRNEMMKPTN